MRPAERRTPSAPRREAFALPEQAQDVPVAEKRTEPTRAQPDREQASDAPPPAGRQAAPAPALKQTDSKTGAAPAVTTDAREVAIPGDEAVTPVDSSFAAQMAATETVAMLAVETLESVDTLESTEADGDLPSQPAPATPAPPAAALPPAPGVVALTPAPSQTTPEAEGAAPNAPLAATAGDTGQNANAPAAPASPDASPAPTSEQAGQKPSEPAATAAAFSDGTSSKLLPKTDAIAAPSLTAPDDSPASAARPAEPVTSGQDSVAPPRLAEAEPSATEKMPSQSFESKAAALETVSRLEQALQPLTLPQRPVDPAPAPVDKPPPLPELARSLPPAAVPVEIGLRALQGLKEFQIRLDPAELGRVDVRLEIGEDKSVSARVVVDRVETLHLLQRDAKTLERAFEQAGLKSTDGGIDISLRDPAQQQQRNGRSDAWTGDGEFANRRSRADDQPDIQPIPVRRTLHVGALDLSI